jgi:hypothetical protein
MSAFTFGIRLGDVGIGSAWRRAALLGVAAAAIGFAGSPAFATENGNQEFPIGVDTYWPAIVPPPGQSVWLNYNTIYNAWRTNDSHGKSSESHFSVHVLAEAPKFVHTWAKIDGLEISSALAQSLVFTNLTIVPDHVTGHSWSIGDTDLVPIQLSGDVGYGLHLLTATNIWVNDGHYDKNNPASPGLNRNTIGQQFQTTWLPTPNWDLSTATIIEFGSKNQATQYYSGSYVNTDYHVGYRFNSLPKWEFGVSGYYMKQFEDDKQYGEVVNGDGNKGQVFAFGPQISFDAWEHGSIVLKYQHETMVENRPQGEKIWIQFAVPFGG